jgi:dihydropteroate synthase
VAHVERLLWRCGSHTFFCGPRTLIAGILNVTPDSFSDGGEFFDPRRAVEHACEMVQAGVDFIDVGGESTRPNASPVDSEEELRRVLPVIEGIRGVSDVPLSIDTTKAEVARRALEHGVEIVNDVSALRADPEMGRVVADSRAGLILMHMQGSPATMQVAPHYDDVVEEVGGFLEERIEAAQRLGIETDRICIDPGIGFGKNLEHNLELVAAGWRLRALGTPVMIGVSRKSFIGKLLGAAPGERLEGSLAAAVAAVLQGADVVRTHDVAETRRACAMADALKPYCIQPETD